MATRIVTPVVVGVAACLLASGAALAAPPTQTDCASYDYFYHSAPPECSFYNDNQASALQHTRVTACNSNIKRCTNDNATCTMDSDCPAGLCRLTVEGVEVVSPAASELVGTCSQNGASEGCLKPVILAHGGGANFGYHDQHYPGANHYTNPYQDMVRTVALAGGAVVFQPILPITSGKTAFDTSLDLLWATQCVMAMTQANCVNNCISHLVDHVDWSAADMEDMTIIGHSAGGVASLYVPKQVVNGLAGIVLIDPARFGTQLVPANVTSAAPIVHIYPDFYGPLKDVENNLFNLGNQAVFSNFTGPWVPFGLRDYDNNNPSCDPDAGCHRAYHCTGFSNAGAYNVGFYSGDSQFCANNLSCPEQLDNKESTDPSTSAANFPTGGFCPPDTYCGQLTKCTRNSGVNPGWADWSWGTGGANSKTILARYVGAYSACMSGFGGGRMQSWVSGAGRACDDTGLAGGGACALAGTGKCMYKDTNGVTYSSPCNTIPDSVTCAANEQLGCVWLTGVCTLNGQASASCGSFTDSWTCKQNEATGCMWTAPMDDTVVRINNGQTVTEYTTLTNRWYTQNQGWNAQTGAFVERNERNVAQIICQ